jgi:DNA invertase Pin-like site-specific DNA recombinase
VQQGRVPNGATLIVESFDRLSRAEPIDAFGVFKQIVDAGLTLVTLDGGAKRFNRQSIRENPFQLFEVLLHHHRSNTESDRKSDLLSESWAKRRKLAVETKKVMTSKAPLWIKRDGEKFVLNRERAKVVKRVLELAKSGVGNHTIIKTLNTEGVPSWPRSENEEAKRAAAGREHTWEPSYIQKMLSQKALYGAVEIKGGTIIEGYYPPLMTHDEYVHLQALRRTRAKRPTTTRESAAKANLFSGLLYCGYCGSQMILNGYTKVDGTQHKYVACHGARTGKTDCRMHGWPIKKLENEVLAFLPEVDFSRVLGQPNKLEAERQLVAVLEQQVDDLKVKIERVYVAIEEGAIGMVPRVKAYEAEQAKAEQQLKIKQIELDALSVHQRGPSAEEYVALRVAMIKATKDPVKLRALREQLAMLINQTVDRLTLYPKGRGMVGEPTMDITFKSGVMREHTPEYVPI